MTEQCFRLSASSAVIATSLLLAGLAPAQAQDTPNADTAQAPAQAQAADPVAPTSSASNETEADDTILVLGARLVGTIDAVQPPILELTQEDIAAYGAGSIAELLSALGPQVQSGRGRGGGQPVILVNGVRISSFRELRSYPPEAIEKFEVFPEEVALQYGYSADQRVVNVILKSQFASRELEAEYGQPWAGGFSTQQIEGTYLQIAGPSRLNANLTWENSSMLTEAERGVIQSSPPTFGTDPDPARYRSLVSDTAGLEGTLNWSTRIGTGNSLSLNASYERDDSLSLQGLDTVTLTNPGGTSALRTFNEADPLAVDRRSQTYSSGATLDLNLGDWQVTGTADLTLGRTFSTTNRRLDTAALVAAAAAGTLPIDSDLGTFSDAGFDEGLSKTYTADTQVTARTRPVYLPAGEVALTLDVEGRWNGIKSTDTRNPGVITDLSRQRLASGFNVSVPVTSRDEDFLGAVGNITLNLGAGLDELSDFGTLTDWTAGVTWGLTEKLTLSATYLNRDTAPTLSQLGSPELATLNVPVFDLSTNQTALVTVISGGNTALETQNQSDWKVGVQWQLPVLDNASFSFDYVNNSSTNVASSFPALTPAIEAAFPDRIVRDGGGRLVQIDQRPVNYAGQDQERLQVGLNLSGQIGSAPATGGRGGTGQSGAERGGPANGGPATGLVGAGGVVGSASPAGVPGGGGFAGDPERFAQIRATFCNADPETLRAQLNAALRATAAGEAPPIGPDGQVLAVPRQMLERLAGEDGVIDETEFAATRTRFCSADGAAGAPGGTPGGLRADPQRFAAIRATFCGADPEVLRAQLNAAVRAAAAGEAPPVGADGQLLAVPPQMLQRLAGEDGVIDEAEFATMRTRICSDSAGQTPGQAAPQGQGGAPAGGPPAGGFAGGGRGAGGGGFGRGFGGGGAGGGNGGGRWFVNLQYAYELNSEVLIAPGIPVLDLLDRDGNQARHSANARLGTFYKGFGLIWDGRYTGSSVLGGTGLPGSTDLRFGDYATLNVRAFADLGQQASLVAAVPFLAGSRIGVNVDNLFDTRQTVTDNAGLVPLRYQPFLIDPVGRRVEVEFRKIF
ncbi:MAG: hypothetical protein ABIT10_02720 [Alteraurantiacibacter sp.]